jgi:hypothetical protein
MTSRPAKTSRGSALTAAQSATTSAAGRAKMLVPDIVTFVTDPRFLDLRISVAQETLLRGIYGEPLVNEEQRDIWRLCTEREYPAHPFSEVTVISGARSGKDSRIAAPIVVYEAFFGGHEHRVAKGEVGTIVLVAQDAKAAGIAFNYIVEYIQQSPVLSAMLDGVPLMNSLRLTNGLVIQCFPCTLRSMRGFSIPVAVMDELGFFRLEGQAEADVEIQTSIRRGMVGFTSGTKLIKISTPYMRGGVLYEDFNRGFGQNDPDLLVWRASSLLMNPSVGVERLDRERRLDPVRFAREYQAEFSEDLAAFLPSAWIEAAVVSGRHELPPLQNTTHVAAVDPNGGGPDAFTLAIVHTERHGATTKVVQDVMKGWSKPRDSAANLEGAVAEIASIVKAFRLATVVGDRYAKGWVREAFARHGITYRDATTRMNGETVLLDRSTAYLEVEPLFAQGHIDILDHPTLIRELRRLERRPHPGGKDRIDHPRGLHDDYANALALAAAQASAAKPKSGVAVTMLRMPTTQEKAQAFLSRKNDDGSTLVRTKFGLERYYDPRGE